MSGNIPLQITVGNSASQVQELENRVKSLLDQFERLEPVFRRFGDTGKQVVAGLNRDIGNLSRVVSTVSSDVTLLNAASRAATNTANAARELQTQQATRQTPQQLAQAYRSNDPQRVNEAVTVTQRQLDATRIRQEQAAQAAASATAGHLRSTQTELRAADREMDRLVARLERLTEAQKRFNAEAAITRGLEGRERGSVVSNRFQQTDTYAADQMARTRDAAEAAASRRQAQERTAQLRRDEADRRREEAPITSALSRLSILNDPRIQAFNEQIRQITTQRGLTNALADLQNPTLRGLTTQVGVARASQRLDTNDAIMGDEGLRTRSRNQYIQRRDDQLWGDGGAAMIALQARLLLQYQLLNQVFSAFTNVTQATLDFDNALKGLQAISASTNGEMATLRSTIIQTSLGTRFSASEITDAATQMAQAGLSIRDIQLAVPAVTLLATATGTTLKNSVDVATTAMTVFRLRADEMPRVADQMTAALNLSKLTMDQVALGLQYVGTTAAEAGLSLTETTATFATLANQGIRSGSTIGTGTRQFLLDLAQPTDDLRKRMAELGLTMSDVDVRTNGIVGVLENLRRVGFTSADMFATMEVRGAAAGAALLRGSSDIVELTTGIQRASGAAEANAVQMESLRSRFLQLQNVINALAFGAFEPFLNALKNTVSGVSDFLSPLAQSNEGLRVFGSLLTALAVVGVAATLTRMVMGFQAVQAAITGARAAAIAFTASVSTVGAASATMTALTAGIAALPLLLIAATGGLAAYIYSSNESSRSTQALTDQMQGLRQSSNEARGALDQHKTALQSVDEFLNNTINRSRALRDGTDALNVQIEEARTRFGNLSTAVYSNITSYNDLIGVLRTVRGELRVTALAAAQTAVESGRAELAVLQGEASRRPEGRREQEALFQDFLRQTGLRGSDAFRRLTMVQQGQVSADPGMLLPEGARNNPDIQRIMDIVLRRGNTPNLEEVSRFRTLLSQEGTGLPEGVATGLTTMLRQQGTLLARIAETSSNLGQSSSTLANLQFQGTPEFQSLADRTQNAQTAFRAMGTINTGPMSLRESTMAQAQATVGATIREIQEEIGRLTPDQQRAFQSSDSGRALDTLRSELATASRQVRDSVRTGATVVARAEISELEADMNRLRTESRSSTDPVVVARNRQEIERIARERERIELENLAPELRRTMGDEGMMGDAFRSALGARTREIMDRTDRDIRQGQIDVASALADDLRNQFREIVEQLRTARQAGRGGGQRGAGSIASLTAAGTDLIRREAALTGRPESWVSAQIAGLTEPNSRSAFGAGQAAARVVNSRPIDRFAQMSQQEMNDITRDARNGVAETLIPGRARRAQLEASRRDPNFGTVGSQQVLQRRVTEADIEAEIQQIDIRNAQIERLATLQADNQKRLQEIQAEIRATRAQGETADGNQRISNLEGQAQTLRGLNEQIPDQLRSATTARDQASALRDARQRNREGNPVFQGFDGAMDQMREQYGPNGQARAFEQDFVSMTNSMRTSFSTLVKDVTSGNKSMGQSFKDFAKNILSAAQEIIANRLAAQLIGMGFKAFGGLMGGLGGGDMGGAGAPTAGMSIGNDFGGATPSFNWPGAYNGGIAVQRFAGGGIVSGAHLGRDSVPAYLAPGEGVLNRSAVSMVGTDTIAAMNKGLMRRQSAMGVMPAPRKPDEVNVYVVAPNEKPQLGAKDILMVIGQDILTGGSTKQLVKQVAVGAI